MHADDARPGSLIRRAKKRATDEAPTRLGRPASSGRNARTCDRGHSARPDAPGFARRIRGRSVMQNRILTSHVGSLIRPPELIPWLEAVQAGRPVDTAGFAATLRQSVANVVRQQAEVGIDIVSDGEFGKTVSWS